MRIASLLLCFAWLVACGGSVVSTSSTDDAGGRESGVEPATGEGGGSAEDAPEVSDGDAATPTIGASCRLLALEGKTWFDGYNLQEVTLMDPGAPTCLVYHFQGLETCPYGQNAAGQGPAGAASCKTSSGQPVVGAVSPQCVDRPASKFVFWSCRCANVEGQTDDGETYCTCPSGMTCAQTITSFGASEDEDDFSGAYCLPPGVEGEAGVPLACSGTCDPTTAPCP